MKTPVDYLNDLKDKFGSDYAAAKLLNSRQTTISMIRKRGQMSDETAIRIADLLGLEGKKRDEIMIAAAIARSEGEAKRAWIEHAKRFGIAASLAAYTLTPIIFGLEKCILC